MSMMIHTSTRAARIADLDDRLNQACIERRMQDAYNLLCERREVEALTTLREESPCQ